MDNKDFSPLINELVCGSWISSSKVSIIITTRIEKRELNNYLQPSEVLVLDSFNIEDAVSFLMRRSNTKMDTVDSNNIVHELGCLPLALEQAAAYLIKTREKPSTYLGKLKKKKSDILKRKNAAAPTSKSDKDRLSVTTTWNLNMEAIKCKYPVAEKVMFILSYLSPRGIPIQIFNEGEPKIEDDDILEVIEDDDIGYLLTILTEMSLFEETEDSTIMVHRVVQDIIRKDLLKNSKVYNEIMTTTQRMMCFALTSSEFPDIEVIKDSKLQDSCISSLKGWKDVVENCGHFLDELKQHENAFQQDIFCNEPFLKILDHSALYYFVLNQRDRANFYSNIFDMILSKSKSVTYKPKYKLPRDEEECEKILNMMEPKTVLKYFDEDLMISSRAIEAKQEADLFMENKKYDLALKAYDCALSMSGDKEMKMKTHLNKCKCLYKLKHYESCLEEAKNMF